jgi:hypothetical protein
LTVIRRDPGLGKLNEVVRNAIDEYYGPLPPGVDSAPVVPIEVLAMEADPKTIWRTVANLRRLAPNTYNAYAGEHFLANAMIDVVVEADCGIDWRGLVAALDKRADAEGEWLVAVPLGNVIPAEPYTELAVDVGLGQTAEKIDRDGGERPYDNFTIFKHLKDRLPIGVRTRSADQRLGPLDLRHTATLYLRQRGTQNLAVRLAVSRARYALAFWQLLKPPAYGEVSGSLAMWEPQPYLRHDIEHKPFEERVWTGGSMPRGRSVTEYSPYELSQDPAKLSAAFRAIELAPDRISARAILGCAWALYLVEAKPGEVQPADQLLLLSGAIEALCDLGEGPDGSDASKRWTRVLERSGVRRELGRRYQQDELKDAAALARDIRNIAAHGSDSVLVNLDYPPSASRQFRGGREVAGRDLALARGLSAKAILLFAVRSVAEHLSEELVKRDFDDDWFRAQLLPGGQSHT